jgi:hypothetical protein
MSDTNAIGIRGQAEIDVAYYFCPYRPGMSEEELEAVKLELSRLKGPTEIQRRIMDTVQNKTKG